MPSNVPPSDWSVYIILCSDDTLYTGISNDVMQRLEKHACHKGAKYFRGRQPTKIVYLESGHNRSTASRREAAIKRLKRSAKQTLIQSALNEIDSIG